MLLSKNEEYYKTLFDTIPHGIQETDVFGEILFVNKAYNKIFGYEEGEVIGTSMLDKLAHESDRDTLCAYLKRLLKEQPTPTPYSAKNRTKDGRIIEVQVDWNYKRDSAGRIVGFISVITDISERKKAEAALKKSEEKFQKLIEHANDAIVSVNAKGMIIGFNKKASKMFGYSGEEVLGKSSYMLISHRNEDFFKEAIAHFAKTGTALVRGVNILEGRGVKKGGEEFQVEYSYYTINIQGEYVSTAIIRDITQRKISEQKLFDYQQKLKSLASLLTLTEEKERRYFAEYLHNEIGQNLFAIQLQLQLLKTSLASADDIQTIDNILNNLKQTIDHSRSLTSELSHPILYELGLEKALEGLVEETYKKYNIEVVLLDDKKEKPLDDDIKIFIYQAVRELLTNVAKHARVEKVTVSVKKHNSSMEICVEDDGAGFDPSRLNGSDSMKAGFGLFHINERIKQLGGEIKIKSQPNRGTKITLTTPLKNAL
jgi:PAS domain S-box-containing protein